MGMKDQFQEKSEQLRRKGPQQPGQERKQRPQRDEETERAREEEQFDQDYDR